jgi:hypothetical protein
MARTKKTGAPGKSRSTRQARSSGADGDAISFLKRQHDATRKLFQELAEAEPEGRNAIFQKLADMLAVHARLEEKHFYAPVARIDKMEEVVRDSLEEHLIVKRFLTDMLEKDLEEEVFEAKCRVLEVEVLHHLGEEETILFPKAKARLPREQLEEMGAQMERETAQLMQGEPRKHISQEIDGAPALG